MSNTGWREVVLGDVGNIITGKTPKTKEPLNFGGEYMFITPRDMSGQKYIHTTERKLSKLGLNSVKNNNIPTNTICVSCIGSDMGKVIITTDVSVTNQQINSIIVKDEDPNFIYYNLLLRQDEIKSGASGSAVPIMNKSTFSSLPINLPPLPTQKAIAKILGDLDAKIELNRKMNESLEAMAQALFQSWFVDFDPVLDNFLAKNGADVEALPEPLRKKGGLRLAVTKKNTPKINELFPDSFVFNEVLEKWIPEGWEDVKLNEIAEVKYGKDHKKLTEGKFPCYGSGGIMRYVDSTLYEDHSVLIPRKGTLSNLMYIRNPFWSVDTMFYTTFKEASHVKFLYYNLKKLNLSEMNVGSAVPSMTTAVLNDLKFVFPSKKNIKRFDFELEDLYLKIESNKSQTQTLIKLRDTLLPQLISGKLSVPEIMLEVENSIK